MHNLILTFLLITIKCDVLDPIDMDKLYSKIRDDKEETASTENKGFSLKNIFRDNKGDSNPEKKEMISKDEDPMAVIELDIIENDATSKTTTTFSKANQHSTVTYTTTIHDPTLIEKAIDDIMNTQMGRHVKRDKRSGYNTSRMSDSTTLDEYWTTIPTDEGVDKILIKRKTISITKTIPVVAESSKPLSNSSTSQSSLLQASNSSTTSKISMITNSSSSNSSVSTSILSVVSTDNENIKTIESTYYVTVTDKNDTSDTNGLFGLLPKRNTLENITIPKSKNDENYTSQISETKSQSENQNLLERLGIGKRKETTGMQTTIINTVSNKSSITQTSSDLNSIDRLSSSSKISSSIAKEDKSKNVFSSIINKLENHKATDENETEILSMEKQVSVGINSLSRENESQSSSILNAFSELSKSKKMNTSTVNVDKIGGLFENLKDKIPGLSNKNKKTNSISSIIDKLQSSKDGVNREGSSTIESLLSSFTSIVSKNKESIIESISNGIPSSVNISSLTKNVLESLTQIVTSNSDKLTENIASVSKSVDSEINILSNSIDSKIESASNKKTEISKSLMDLIESKSESLEKKEESLAESHTSKLNSLSTLKESMSMLITASSVTSSYNGSLKNSSEDFLTSKSASQQFRGINFDIKNIFGRESEIKTDPLTSESSNRMTRTPTSISLSTTITMKTDSPVKDSQITSKTNEISTAMSTASDRSVSSQSSKKMSLSDIITSSSTTVPNKEIVEALLFGSTSNMTLTGTGTPKPIIKTKDINDNNIFNIFDIVSNIGNDRNKGPKDDDLYLEGNLTQKEKDGKEKKKFKIFGVMRPN